MLCIPSLSLHQVYLQLEEPFQLLPCQQHCHLYNISVGWGRGFTALAIWVCRAREMVLSALAALSQARVCNATTAAVVSPCKPQTTAFRIVNLWRNIEPFLYCVRKWLHCASHTNASSWELWSALARMSTGTHQAPTRTRLQREVPRCRVQSSLTACHAYTEHIRVHIPLELATLGRKRSDLCNTKPI